MRQLKDCSRTSIFPHVVRQACGSEPLGSALLIGEKQGEDRTCHQREDHKQEEAERYRTGPELLGGSRKSQVCNATSGEEDDREKYDE